MSGVEKKSTPDTPQTLTPDTPETPTNTSFAKTMSGVSRVKLKK